MATDLPAENDLLIESAGQAFRRRSLKNIGFMTGLAIVALVASVAMLAPILTGQDPYLQNFDQRLIPPFWHSDGTWAHPLGTDKFGRDYLSRIIYGSRISLLIGLFVMVISGLIGSTLGVIAGYFGGKVDAVIMYIITVRLSMPVVLVALAVVSFVGSSLEVIVLVLGLFLWDRFAVVIRAATKRLRGEDFVTAARCTGCPDSQIILREIIPNLMNQLTVIATLEMAQAILLESALSFLGLGVQPPLPSWGLMIAEAKEFVFFDPWLITIPGVAIFLLVLGINLLGDGVRDLTAPEMKN